VAEVFVPARNKKNVKDISKEITGGLEITYVAHVKEIIQKVFV
jgi:ATP-dependent Lon protease